MPEGNGCAERFIRTLKENLLWIRTFDTIEELRLALLAFRDIYNTTWLIQPLAYPPPAPVRQQQLSAVAIAAWATHRCLVNRGQSISLPVYMLKLPCKISVLLHVSLMTSAPTHPGVDYSSRASVAERMSVLSKSSPLNSSAVR